MCPKATDCCAPPDSLAYAFFHDGTPFEAMWAKPPGPPSGLHPDEAARAGASAASADPAAKAMPKKKEQVAAAYTAYAELYYTTAAA